MTTFISMDGEFSGLDHTKYELISIGLCDCYNLNDVLYLEIQPTKFLDPQATAIHGLQRDYLLQNGKPREQAAKEIHQWLTARKKGDLIFVGYPVVLDWIFLDQLFKEHGLDNPFHYEQMDIHSMGVALLGLKPGFPHETLRRELGLKKQTDKHNALADARHQAEEFVALTKLAESLRTVEVEES